MKYFPFFILSPLLSYAYLHPNSTPKENADKDPQKLERLAKLSFAYEEGYKRATGDGARHKEAHLEGLDAVCIETLRLASLRPSKNYAHRIVSAIERKLRP